MAEELINLADTEPQPEEELLSLPSPDTDKAPPSRATATRRAFKASLGLGQGKSVDEYSEDILAGNEEQIRSNAVAENSLRNMVLKEELLLKASQEKGRPLTEDEIRFVTATRIEPSMHKKFSSKAWPEESTSVIEESYAKQYVDYAKTLAAGTDSIFDLASKETPELMEEGEHQVRSMVAKKAIARTMAEDVRDEIENQSWFGWGIDTIKRFIPGYDDVKLRGNVEGSSVLKGLLGTNVEDQTRKLLLLPLPEFRTRLKEIVDSLRADNPQLAEMFLSYVLGKSTEDITLDNMINVADLATYPSLAASGARMLGNKAIIGREVNKAFKDLAKISDIDGITKAHIADAVGDLGEAAVQRSTNKLIAEFKGSADPVKDAIEALPSYLKTDVEGIKAGPGRLGQEIVNRLSEQYNRFTSNLLETITNIQRVERIPAVLATEKAVRKLQQEIKDQYPGLRNAILDVSAPIHNPVTNTYSVDLMVGKPRGELFRIKEQAENFARVNGLPVDKVEQAGNGWFIRINRNVRENSDVVRDALLATPEAKAPDSWLNTFAGWLRTPEDIFSMDQRMNRKVATYAPQELYKVAKEEAKVISKIKGRPWTEKRKKFEEFKRILELGQDKPDPRDGIPGYFYRTVEELEQDYLTHFKRLPDEQEIEAYFAFKRMVEMDRVLRNLAVYKNKARVGAENHTVRLYDDTVKAYKEVNFDGVMKNGLPGGDDPILFAGNKLGQEHIYSSSAGIPATVKKDIEKDIKEGKLKVVDIYDVERRPFADIPNVGQDRVRYVIAPNVDTKPLSWDQVPRRGGGHIEYDYDFYIKQANLRPERYGKQNEKFRMWYEGDTTVMPIGIRKMGQDIVKHLDTARELLRKKDVDGAKAYVQKHLPMDWEEFRGWFIPHKIDNRVIPARLSLDEPFKVVPKGGSIIGMDKALESRYSNFVDGTRTGSLARVNQVEYTGQRDAYEIFTIKDEGSKDNPLYKYVPADKVDPIASMDRGLSKIINSTLMDDYKVFAVEHWIEAAKQHLKPTEAELRYSPYYYFNKPDWKPDAPKEEIQQLMNQHEKIRQFVGVQDATGALLQSAAQKLADTIYGKYGPNAMVIDPVWAIPKLQDPIAAMRAFTFHAKLGLFAVPQFLVQSQTYVTIMGIAGAKYAVPGSTGALLNQLARLNKSPKMLDKLDEIASRLNIPGASKWKPGEFKEAHAELQKTGFGHVAGEYAMLDDALSTKVFSSGGKKFLDAGAFFFREGERNVRYGAWYTAFREFRDANPTKKLTEKDRRTILERADILQVNMSRASSSSLHTGIMSLPGQFLSYQLRLFELMASKRLTGMEKMRLFGYTAAMYGAPASLGLSGMPLGDMIRKYAVENNYVVGEDWIQSTIMEGLPAAFMAMVSGTWYNVGDRYGAQGFEFLRDALQSDTPWWEIMGGAAYGTTAGTVGAVGGSLSNFYRAMMSGIKGDGEVFPLTLDDMLDVGKEIGSVNSARRLWIALQTGRWLSKNGMLQDRVTNGQAWFQTLTGLTNQQLSDAYKMQWSMRDQEETYKEIEKQFTQEYRKGLMAQETNPDQAQKFFTRAFAIIQLYPENRRYGLITQANKDYETVIQRTNWDFYMKKVPDDARETRQEGYRKFLEVEDRKQMQKEQ